MALLFLALGSIKQKETAFLTTLRFQKSKEHHCILMNAEDTYFGALLSI